MPPPVFPPRRASWRASAAGALLVLAAGAALRAAAMETYRYKDPHGVWRSMKVPRAMSGMARGPAPVAVRSARCA